MGDAHKWVRHTISTELECIPTCEKEQVAQDGTENSLRLHRLSSVADQRVFHRCR